MKFAPGKNQPGIKGQAFACRTLVKSVILRPQGSLDRGLSSTMIEPPPGKLFNSPSEPADSGPPAQPASEARRSKYLVISLVAVVCAIALAACGVLLYELGVHLQPEKLPIVVHGGYTISGSLDPLAIGVAKKDSIKRAKTKPIQPVRAKFEPPPSPARSAEEGKGLEQQGVAAISAIRSFAESLTRAEIPAKPQTCTAEAGEASYEKITASILANKDVKSALDGKEYPGKPGHTCDRPAKPEEQR